MYIMSKKKRSHFNFWQNFAIWWDIFTIFKAPGSGIISARWILLQTHQQCEAFTWHNVCQAVAPVVGTVHWHGFHGLELRGLKPCWLFSLEYQARESKHTANQDELKHWWDQVWAELDHGLISAAIGQWQCHLNAWTRAWKFNGDILNNIRVEFTCSPLVCLLNSRPT